MVEKVSVPFSQSLPIGWILLSPWYGKLMGRSMHFPYDDIWVFFLVYKNGLVEELLNFSSFNNEFQINLK